MAELTCPRCGRPCPRIIRWRQADGERAECPRCCYPDQHYLGGLVPTMPAADHEWYERMGL